MQSIIVVYSSRWMSGVGKSDEKCERLTGKFEVRYSQQGGKDISVVDGVLYESYSFSIKL